MVIPKQLNGISLAPFNKAGDMYCAEFQGGSCRADVSGCAIGSCPSGLHKCAALFRGGRTCHGNHPGGLCEYTKRFL